MDDHESLTISPITRDGNRSKIRDKDERGGSSVGINS
jgi:hypothetical protein